jgi:hypothetical protein
MTTRFLVNLAMALVLAVPAQAQGSQPQAEPRSQPSFSSTFRFQPQRTISVTPRHRLGSLSVNALLAPTPRLDTTDIACPMPVMRPRPGTADSMPRLAIDSTVAPATNRSLLLPSCSNELFRE